jgi:hypothetical protein
MKIFTALLLCQLFQLVPICGVGFVFCKINVIQYCLDIEACSADKNGKLTLRSNIDTDLTTYLSQIYQIGGDPEDPYYTDILQKLERKPDAFYKRTFLPSPKPEMVERIWEDFQDTAIMVAVEGCQNKMMNLGSGCTFCEFQPLCDAQLFRSDDDLNFLLQNQYQERVQREQVKVE